MLYVKRVMTAFAATAVLALGVATHSEDTEPKGAAVISDPVSLKAAVDLARKYDGNKDVQKYRHETYYPYFGPRAGRAIDTCLMTVKEPSFDPFVFILTINATGKIEHIDLNHVSNVSVCVTKKLSLETLPPPPVTPFAERMDIKIRPK